MEHKNLTDKELKVMLAIIQRKDDAYGVSIRLELLERTGDDLKFGVLYTVLERLQKRGLIKSKMGEPTAERGGRRKKFFQVTGVGQIAVSHALLKIDNLKKGLSLPKGGLIV